MYKKERGRERQGNRKGEKRGEKRERSFQETREEDSNYRDRARERREGINKDFDLCPDDFQLHNPIQESKYLGGDKERTHLVMGLDFELLEKVKKEQTNIDIDDEEMISYESKFANCRTALARRILNLHEEKYPEKSDLFLPGRMIYSMNLVGDQPVTAIIRSKAEH